MHLNSWLLDSLIRERLSDARDRAAKHALLRSVKPAPRTRRHAWVDVLKAFGLTAAPAIERGRRTTRSGLPGTLTGRQLVDRR